jgi:hypothetical protein
LAAALTTALWTAVAAFGQETTLREALLRNQAAAEAALYETTDGDRVFVLDRTGDPPLLKFQDSFEVLALDRVPAARGDEILRTDTGDDLVRVTALGGVTLYPRERPTGVPATRLGPSAPLPPLDETRPNMVEAFRSLTANAREAEVDAPVSPASASAANALLADAVRLTAEGLRVSAAAAQGGEKLAGLRRIEFVYGAGADARMTDGVLSVQINTEGGYAGRPSSLKVADAVLGGG